MTEAPYHYWDVARTEMVPFVPTTATTLLDVGCGLGGFAAELKRRRPTMRITGVEGDSKAAETARTRCDDVVVGLFPEALDGRTFDCIVFNDVLEHMVDPWAALRAARASLNPGGAVVASIPNLRYFLVLYRLVVERDFTYVADGVLDRTHLRFFTHRTASAMFEQCGLRVETTEAINQIDPTTLPPRYRRTLSTICRLRPDLGHDLRAQQYAFVARPVGGA